MADYPVEFIVEGLFWDDERWMYDSGDGGEPPAVGDEIRIIQLGDQGRGCTRR